MGNAIRNKTIILREVLVDGERIFDGFTSVKGALEDSGITEKKIYNTCVYYLASKRAFNYGNIVFRRVNLNHYKVNLKRK